MPYLGNRPDNVVIRNAQQEFNYTATSSQTTFTGADSNNTILAYNVGNVEVFFNGARLEEADFTATTGTSIVLASAAATNDLISVVSTDVFESTDTVSKANGGTFSSNVIVSGLLTADNISTGGYIRGPSSLTIDPATHGDNTGTVVIAGDLTVNGTTTQVNSNEVNIGDNILKLNSDEAGTPSQNAGIEVERGTSTNVAFRWNETTDKWQFTNDGSSYIDLGESDLVGDTTPQLGGDLDTNSKNIEFGDSSGATVNRLTFGASSDLQIYHDGNSKIADVGGGKLELHSDGTGVFIQKGATEYMAKFETDGAVTLYHDNSPKLATSSTGASVTGTIELTGDISTGGVSAPTSSDTGNVYIKSGSTLGFQSHSGNIAWNGVFNSGWKYIASNVASMVNGTSTGLSFYTAASGTAGNALTWDEKFKIHLDGYSHTSGRGFTVDNSDAGWHAINIAESIDNRIAFRITPSRQGQTKGISMGAIGTSNTDTGLQAYDTSNNSANDFLINPWGGNVGIGIASGPGTSLHIKDAITNPNTISSNITIPASSNSMMAGPITLNATVTIPSGSSWTIV